MVAIRPVEHCQTCGDVIFFYRGFWVHGTDHVAVPESETVVTAEPLDLVVEYEGEPT